MDSNVSELCTIEIQKKKRVVGLCGELDLVIMIVELGAFWALSWSTHIVIVVSRKFFHCCRGQHGQDGETNRLHGERRRPVVAQNVETNVTIAVDMRMHRRRRYKNNFWRVHGIVIGEANVQQIRFAGINCVLGANEGHLPRGIAEHFQLESICVTTFMELFYFLEDCI